MRSRPSWMRHTCGAHRFVVMRPEDDGNAVKYLEICAQVVVTADLHTAVALDGKELAACIRHGAHSDMPVMRASEVSTRPNIRGDTAQAPFLIDAAKGPLPTCTFRRRRPRRRRRLWTRRARSLGHRRRCDVAHRGAREGNGHVDTACRMILLGARLVSDKPIHASKI